MRHELSEIRARGHAFDDEEHEPGIICIAVPILTRSGRVSGRGVGDIDHGAGPDLDGLTRHLPALRAAVSAIAGEAQDWRFPDQAAE